MNGKNVLVLGGTGAMGVYLVPELANLPAGFPKPQETVNAKMDVYVEAHGW